MGGCRAVFFYTKEWATDNNIPPRSVLQPDNAYAVKRIKCI